MERAEKRRLIERALARAQAADAAWAALEAANGEMDTEGPLGSALFYAIGDLLDATSALIGDEDDSLSWFAYDNAYGAKGLQWTAVGRPPISVRTIDGLMDCIGLAEDGRE